MPRWVWVAASHVTHITCTPTTSRSLPATRTRFCKAALAVACLASELVGHPNIRVDPKVAVDIPIDAPNQARNEELEAPIVRYKTQKQTIYKPRLAREIAARVAHTPSPGAWSSIFVGFRIHKSEEGCGFESTTRRTSTQVWRAERVTRKPQQRRLAVNNKRPTIHKLK